MKRIAELQRQIDELRRQVETGSAKTLVSQVVTASKVAVPNADAETVVTAFCPTGKTLTGGGFDFAITSAILLHFSGPGPGSSWTVKVLNSDPPESEQIIKAFAICADLE